MKISSLDGMCIFRYAHIFKERESGGTEQYLRTLDRGILEEHRVKIVRTCLVKESTGELERVCEKVGRGEIVWLPMVMEDSRRSLIALARRIRIWLRVEEQVRVRGENRASRFRRKSGLMQLRKHLTARTMIASEALRLEMDAHRVDLTLMHWTSYDANWLVKEREAVGYGLGLINHFDNKRLSAPYMKAWVDAVDGIGGVTDCDVPSMLRNRFRNLSDCIDLTVFQPRAEGDSQDPCMILLPSRIVPGKGHKDIMLAAMELLNEFPDLHVQFVGAVSSTVVENTLQELGYPQKLMGAVRTVGEVSQSKLREVYERAAIVVLPSYSEGLGKVLLEAQAMKRPVVAYRTGGIPSAIQDGGSGYLIEVGDIVGLTSRLKALLRSRDLREEMGARGRAFVEGRFSMEAMKARHLDFYREILAVSAGRRMARAA